MAGSYQRKTSASTLDAVILAHYSIVKLVTEFGCVRRGDSSPSQFNITQPCSLAICLTLDMFCCHLVSAGAAVSCCVPLMLDESETNQHYMTVKGSVK